MRVIAGTYRRRKLLEVDSQTTRETKDRVKESIFNSITDYLPKSTVLDLFCGSGSLGIEALSRKATSCVFVDHNKHAINVTKANIKNLDITNATVIHQDYLSYLESCEKVFDVIILDPPYALNVIENIIKIIQEKNLLSPHGVVVCLYSKNNSLHDDSFGIIEYKQKTIGITKVSYMKWGE